MRQNKVHKITSKDGQDVYYIVRTLTKGVNAVADGIVISIFQEEPSGSMMEAEADAVVQLEVGKGPDAIQVLAHLWDDKTHKEDFPTHSITLIGGKKQEGGDYESNL